MSMEVWKDIEDFPNYQVSDQGRVRNKNTECVLKPRLSEWGYEQVSLYLHKHHWRYIHKLVAEAFIANPENKPMVNHKDGNKSNNVVTNLEWCTHGENNKHAYNTGLKQVSENVRKHARKMATSEKTRQAAFDRHPNIKIVETGEIFESNVAVAKRLNCNVQSVWATLHKKQHTCQGYRLEYIEKVRQPFLYDHQMEAVKKIRNGSILNGGVGSGKSRTALFYYFKENGGWIDEYGYKPMENPKDLYIITTAHKRDTLEWEKELLPFLMSVELGEHNMYNQKIVIDSWNNISKYTNVTDSYFLFDEQRVVGSGAWVKAFLKIARVNDWILLSATPGDTWQDYVPVFIANGFFRNKTEFNREHCVFSRFTKFPKVERYLNTTRLIRLRNNILIDMDFDRHTVPHHEDVYCRYDIPMFKDAMRNRWDPYKNEPIINAAGLCYVLRRIVNSDQSRQVALMEIIEKHPRAIIFYNFDYELEILKELYYGEDVEVAEWNGHAHQPVPDTDKWIYLVQYTAGCEGWNCIKTDTIIFYSQNYSYKVLAQACGRIDRLNTPFKDLYYYHLKSRSGIDLAISKALSQKKKFNERKFTKWD